MSWISIDVEADGVCPGLYSMICFGAVIVDEKLDKTFYGQLMPISDKWVPEALAVSGFTREQTMQFPDPKETMTKFRDWISQNSTGRPMFISDNNGFDWQFINYYFHAFLGENPFGYSSTNLGSLFKGMQKSMKVSFKYLRKTKHSHDPVQDALGNAEAFIEIQRMGLRI